MIRIHFFRRYRRTLWGLILGAIAGYGWYALVGCNSGTCAITSRPLNSTLYGAFMGALLANSFVKTQQKQSTKNQSDDRSTNHS